MLGDVGTVARAERQGPTPQGPTPPATAQEDAVQGLVAAALSRAEDASPGPSQQPAQPGGDEAAEELDAAVPWGLVAHAISPPPPARTAHERTIEHAKSAAPAAQRGPEAHAGGGSLTAGGASVPSSAVVGDGPGEPGQVSAGQRCCQRCHRCLAACASVPPGSARRSEACSLRLARAAGGEHLLEPRLQICPRLEPVGSRGAGCPSRRKSLGMRGCVVSQKTLKKKSQRLCPWSEAPGMR
nr:PREDICTED: atherin-like isoform X3 [Apteryx mantelli mantelli]